MVRNNFMGKEKLCYLTFLVLFVSFECSYQQATSKKHSNRVAKSNKTNKRQEQASVFPRVTEPEFDQSINYEKPRSIVTNITAIIGHNAYLPCVVRNIGSYKILWLRISDGDVLAYDNMLISQDSRFSLIKNFPNESNLLIQNVNLKDSGQYACQINTQSLKAKFVNLMVLSKIRLKILKFGLKSNKFDSFIAPPTFIDNKREANDEYSTQLALASPLISSGSNHRHLNHIHHHISNSNSHEFQYSQEKASTKSIDINEGEKVSLGYFKI